MSPAEATVPLKLSASGGASSVLRLPVRRDLSSPECDSASALVLGAFPVQPRFLVQDLALE